MEPTGIKRIYKRSIEKNNQAILNTVGMVIALHSTVSQRMNHMVLMCPSRIRMCGTCTNATWNSAKETEDN